ncbi:MAG: hypothetical protein ORN57_05440, partial [Alphaproteobacteria bacterium]|nr:hypothetical protein [Alphaproteobacteria bacterium]
SRATPFLFCGLATAMSFRAGIYNLAAEGQFLAGLLFAGFFIYALGDYHWPVLFPLVILLGVLGGLLVGLVMGLLKRIFHVHEILSSILVIYLLQWVFYFFIRLIGPGDNLPDQATINYLFPETRFNEGIYYALLTAVIFYFFYRYHLFSFQIKLMGKARHLVFQTGKREETIYWLVLLTAAGVAGLAGSIELLDNWHNLQNGLDDTVAPFWLLEGGVLAAVYLGRTTPLGVTLASFFMSAMGILINIGKEKWLSGSAIRADGLFLLFCAILLACLSLFDMLARYKVNIDELLQQSRQENKTNNKKTKTK